MKKINFRKIVAGAITQIVGTLFCAGVFAAQLAAPYTNGARYDLGGMLTGTILPDPDGSGPRRFPATRNTYNASGLLVKIETGELSNWYDENTAPAAWGGFTIELTKVFRYDQYGRKTVQATLNKSGWAENLVQFNYDNLNHVNCKVVRMNSLSYSEANLSALPDACTPVQTSSGYDRVTKYTYNSLDEILTENRAYGTALNQVYITNTYLPGTRLLDTQMDANGNVTKLEYDTYKRLYRRYYPTATRPASQNIFNPGTHSTADYNQYTYDTNGNIAVERKRNGATITNTYDNNNRLIFKNLSNNTYSSDVSYNYDLRGLTLSSRVNSDAGAGITNVFDGFGNLKTATTNMDGTTRTLTYNYDKNGNRERITHPDGIYFGYLFDGINRVTTLTESGTSVISLNYRINGRRDTLSRNGSATVYTYDDAARLKTFQQNLVGTANDLTNTFTYNPASQVVTLNKSNTSYNYVGNANRAGTYVTNGLNQYTNVGGSVLQYTDAKGNLTQDGADTYIYDDENRLVSTSGSVASTLKYDPLGRLYETTIAGVVTRFLYDGDALVAEYNSSNGLTRRYAHGDQVDEPWVQYNTSLTGSAYRRFLHADHQGSIIAHSDGSGNVLNKLTYDSYGIPGTNNLDRFGYTGQIWLKGLGLFHYKARMYSPRLGRFLQTDPIFYADQMNMYAYVGNDPVNKIDPTGMQTYDPQGMASFHAAINDPATREAIKDVAEAIASGDTSRLNVSTEKVAKAIVETRIARTHGNSRASTRLQHRYEIRNKATGDVVKTGISGRSLNNNGTSPRANSQVNAINKTAAEGDKVEGEVKEKDIPGREAALNNEQAATNQLNTDGHSLERQCRPKPNQSGGC